MNKRNFNKLVSMLALTVIASSCSYEPSPNGGKAASPEPTEYASPKPSPSSAPAAEQITDYELLDSKGVGWGFVRKKGAPPEITARQKEVLDKFGAVYLDESSGASLYLTFDEGYENGFTSRILDILAEKNVPAAFFVTGPYLKSQRELVRRMIDEGHIVGNHTVNHLNLPNQTVDTVKAELDGLNKACEEMYGTTMKYMRPPEGEYSERVLAAARDMGYKTILWSMAYKDWDVNIQNGAKYAYEQVVPYLHGGAVILLHAVSSDNTAALGDIIDEARNEGYEFRSLDELGGVK